MVASIVGIGVFLGVPILASASEEVPSPIVDGAVEALDAWSEFATTGDLAVLDSSFVRNGPQWRQFEAESAAWTERPVDEPLRLQVRQFRLRHLDPTTATVWVEVKASRAGFVSEVFGWDFDLVRENGGWRVWTVVPAGEPPDAIQVADTPATDSTTTLAPLSSVAEARDSGLVGVAATSPPGTRIPLLSAWIVVVTVVGVAVAGYMAPRFDRGSEG